MARLPFAVKEKETAEVIVSPAPTRAASTGRAQRRERCVNASLATQVDCAGLPEDARVWWPSSTGQWAIVEKMDGWITERTALWDARLATQQQETSRYVQLHSCL